MGTESETLFAMPDWQQLNDPLPDQAADPFASFDCGWECAAIAEFALSGAQFSAGALRQAWDPRREYGQSNAQDLAGVLRELGRQPRIHSDQASAAFTATLAQAHQNRTSIVLGYWISPIVLHWRIVCGYGADYLCWCDPLQPGIVRTGPVQFGAGYAHSRVLLMDRVSTRV